MYRLHPPAPVCGARGCPTSPRESTVKQERAARTREALVQAAAEAFDRAGFHGTSLGRISKAAGISMGALTFHFPTKDELADTVQLRGLTVTRDAVQRLLTGREAALETVVDLTLELAALLQEEAVVRAAARLTRERESAPQGAPWPSSWLPAVEGLLEAMPAGQLRAGCDPRTVLALVGHLVAGVESYLRSCAAQGCDTCKSAPEQLARIWELALYGIRCGRQG
ncbi:TetR/AcrR family transcriptional regulator [Streptomyces spectabilis]|uniref:TetR/AcrR family transcriptional regulator n=1 Tax=Streptomyces spectabilis TaxID=68270 RepID=A0A5P2X4R2_STRST|nr:TetR/AcrR family transcriptional regulator [Streptomyces spectabilis]QEV64362.1 TetR/AcrR family transcriptional regulator [Streptomyces spectabilis]